MASRTTPTGSRTCLSRHLWGVANDGFDHGHEIRRNQKNSDRLAASLESVERILRNQPTSYSDSQLAVISGYRLENIKDCNGNPEDLGRFLRDPHKR